MDAYWDIVREVHHVFHVVVFLRLQYVSLPTPRKIVSEINMSSDQNHG